MSSGILNKKIRETLNGYGLVERRFADYDNLPTTQNENIFKVPFEKFEEMKEEVKSCSGGSYLLNSYGKCIVICKKQ